MISFKNLKIKWKIFIPLGVVLLVYVYYTFLVAFQAKESNFLSEEISVLKEDNTFLIESLFVAKDLALDVDMFLLLNSAGYLDSANDNILIILEKVSKIKKNNTRSGVLNEINDVLNEIRLELNELDNLNNALELNSKRYNIYSNLNILNEQIGNALKNSDVVVRDLINKQKESILTKLKIILILGMAVFLLILISVYNIYVSLLKPLVILEKKINLIKNKNFDVKIDSYDYGNNEIGSLSNSFNAMVVKLKDSYSILEEKVKDRTLELEREKTSLDFRVKERTAELEILKNNLENLVKERTQRLDDKLNELERINKLMVNRELKMIELKKEVENLKKNVQIIN